MSQLEKGCRVLVVAAVMMVISMAVTFHCGVAEAKTYLIKWQENPDLGRVQGKHKKLWAGEKILFSYTRTDEYNVIIVDEQSYNNCSVGGKAVHNTGQDEFTLNKGWQYFICGYYSGSHCRDSKMKAAIFAY